MLRCVIYSHIMKGSAHTNYTIKWRLKINSALAFSGRSLLTRPVSRLHTNTNPSQDLGSETGRTPRYPVFNKELISPWFEQARSHRSLDRQGVKSFIHGVIYCINIPGMTLSFMLWQVSPGYKP